MTSWTRRLRSWPLAMPWIANGSPMIDPTRRRGFSDPYGSWKIICISRRNGRMLRRDSVVMSCPSKVTFPDVMSCSRTMQRASVDFPHPVSPTRPRVCPLRTSRFTPSTACTTSRCLWNTDADCTGKYLTRFSTRSRTSLSLTGAVAGTPASVATPSRPSRRGEALANDSAAHGVTSRGVMRKPAGGQVPLVPADRRERGHLGAAPVHHVRTPGVEGTARRQGDQAGRLPLDRPEPLTPSAVGGQRLQQPLGVGMMVGEEHGPPIGLLHHCSCVHHHDLVRDVRDHPEIVGDQDDGGAELVLQGADDLRTWACTVTSSAVVGSSAMSSSGLSAMAIAIIARCRMPPENWCGKSSTLRSACGMPTRRSNSMAGARACAFDIS